MATALPLTGYISQASQNTTTYKVIETKYGNGYAQRAADGNNANQGSWSLTWSPLSTADFNTLVNAFDTAAGVGYFTWTAPGDSTAKKWNIQSHTRKPMSGSLYEVSATLNQVFDIV